MTRPIFSRGPEDDETWSVQCAGSGQVEHGTEVKDEMIVSKSVERDVWGTMAEWLRRQIRICTGFDSYLFPVGSASSNLAGVVLLCFAEPIAASQTSLCIYRRSKQRQRDNVVLGLVVKDARLLREGSPGLLRTEEAPHSLTGAYRRAQPCRSAHYR